MTFRKIKEIYQKILTVFSLLIAIIGIGFLLKTIEKEELRENFDIMAFEIFDKKDLETKNYYSIIKSGDVIERGSIEKYNSHKKKIQNEYSRVIKKKGRLERRLEKIKSLGSSNKKRTNKIKKIEYRINDLSVRKDCLNLISRNLKALESSTDIFKLNELPINALSGNLTYDYKNDTVLINYISGQTYSFIHEATHAYQFYAGYIVFVKNTKLPTALDIPDEVWAYRAQYAYDPMGVKRMTSNKKINGIEDIDEDWVLNIKNLKAPKGDPRGKPYQRDYIYKEKKDINTTLGELLERNKDIAYYDKIIKLEDLLSIPSIRKLIANKPIDKSTALSKLRILFPYFDFNNKIKLKHLPNAIIGDSELIIRN
ncbi:hypothetical protein [Flavivirga eckloniae]|nr:hypothetical protein [Flavivirga eckloniae]